MFGTMAGEESGIRRARKDDIKVFRAAERTTESTLLLFGVEAVFWPTAANKEGKWYRGVVEAEDGLDGSMAKWHAGGERRGAGYDTQHKSLRVAARAKGRGGGVGRDTGTAVDESKKEIARFKIDNKKK